MGQCLRIVSLIIHWLFFVITIVLLVSGLGITYARQVEKLSFGLLSKPIAFKIHEIIWIPFIILLFVHLILIVGKRKFKTKIYKNNINN